MVLVLTCVFCAAMPAIEPPARTMLLEERLSLQAVEHRRPMTVPTLALGASQDHGAGEGQGRSSHMGPMWIVMGAMMALMMVGMAVYLMRGADGGQTLGVAAPAAPAQQAIPVSAPRAGGG